MTFPLSPLASKNRYNPPMQEELSLIQKIIVWAVPVLFAITVHEVAHGWVANRLGDATAKMAGRLTINPIRHVDPVGTVLVPGLLLAIGGFLFGWAKPVPVNFGNLNHPKRDMIYVAIAGPGANLVMAFIWGAVGLLARYLPEFAAMPLLYMSIAGLYINAILMLVNMIPLPPLDGGRVVAGLLPPALANSYSKLEPYGLFIMLGLLATGMLGKILGPPLFAFLAFMASLFSIPLGFARYII
jgi:Zn-dependent protease